MPLQYILFVITNLADTVQLNRFVFTARQEDKRNLEVLAVSDVAISDKAGGGSISNLGGRTLQGILLLS